MVVSTLRTRATTRVHTKNTGRCQIRLIAIFFCYIMIQEMFFQNDIYELSGWFTSET